MYARYVENADVAVEAARKLGEDEAEALLLTLKWMMVEQWAKLY